MKKYPSLIGLIFFDCLKHYKLPLLLLVLILITAQGAIWITLENRQIADEKVRALLAKDGLEYEWDSLILESNALAGDDVIEKRARQLGLIPIDSNETVIMIKSDAK